MNEATILIVDDNPEIRDVLRILLGSEGYLIREAANGMEALSKVDSQVDLVILDIMMPGITGLKTCQKIREASNVPILFLTARTQDTDKSLGLLIGGDDYLAKPFSHAELTARVKALLRRYQVYKGKETDTQQSYYTVSEFRVNKEYNEVFLQEQEVNLSEIEYKILRLMISHPRQIHSAQVLYENVWDEPFLYSSSATVMVHIRKLRVKLEADPQNPKHIVTIWGKGYRFE